MMGWGRHLVVLAALIVNLWIGGDFIEAWAGILARVAFELVLILAYVVLVLRFGTLLRRDPDDRRPE